MDLAYLRGISYDATKSVVKFSNEGISDVPNIYTVYNVFYRGLMDAHVPCVKPIGFYFIGTSTKVAPSKLFISDYCLESLPEVMEELSRTTFFINGGLEGATTHFSFKSGNRSTEPDSVETSACRGYGNNKIYGGASAYVLTYTSTNIATGASSKPALNNVRLLSDAGEIVRRVKNLPIEKQIMFDIVGNRKLIYTPKNKNIDSEDAVCMILLLAEGTGSLPMKNISSMFVDQNDLLAEANRFVYLNTNFSYIDYLRILPRLGPCKDEAGNYEFKVAGSSLAWNKFVAAWKGMLDVNEKRKWLGSDWTLNTKKEG